VPFAALFFPAVPDGAARHSWSVRELVPDEEFPFAVLFVLVAGKPICPHESARLITAFGLDKFDEKRGIRVSLRIVEEIRRRLFIVELFEDHMIDAIPERTILACKNRDPLVGVFRNLAEVRSENDHFRPVMT